MAQPIAQVQTKTGALVRLFKGEEGWPELGPGLMLMIDMPFGDGRHAEVFLDDEVAAVLGEALS